MRQCLYSQVLPLKWSLNQYRREFCDLALSFSLYLVKEQFFNWGAWAVKCETYYFTTILSNPREFNGE